MSVPSDTPSGHRGSPGGRTHAHMHLARTPNLHAQLCVPTRTGDPSNGVNWPSVAVSYVMVYDGDPKVTPKRPSCAPLQRFGIG